MFRTFFQKVLFLGVLLLHFAMLTLFHQWLQSVDEQFKFQISAPNKTLAIAFS